MIALIPYFEQPETTVFGSRLQAWDVLVFLGFVVGVWIAARAARWRGRDPGVVLDYAPWVLLGGFTVAHLVHVLFYEPQLLQENPWVILYIWSGLSSFGGFLGATLTTVIFFHRHKESFWTYCDPLAVGMAPAWTIARIGCFLAHDHKGVESDFFLAVDFPSGPRHDLGLYEAGLSFVLSLVVAWLFFRKYPNGTAVGALCFLYGITRFFLDFLRADDARYGGFTPAQFGAIVLAFFGLYALVRALRVRRKQEA